MSNTFEDLLVAPAISKCKTCQFISVLDEPLQSEVRAAIGKAIYSNEVIARGFAKIDTEINPAPKETAIRTHRASGHA